MVKMNDNSVKSVPKMSLIEIQDIFDELKEENKRLENELLFAKKSFLILNKFKTYINKTYHKLKSNLDLKDIQELQELENEYMIFIEENEINYKVINQQNYENKTLLNNGSKSSDNSEEFICINDMEIIDEKYSLNERIIKTKNNGSHQKSVNSKSFENKKVYSSGTVKSFMIVSHLKKHQNKHKNNGNNFLNSNNERIGNDLTLNEEKLINQTVNETNREIKKKDFLRKRTFGVKTKYKCDYIGCDYQTERKSVLIVHKNRHLGRKPFKCLVSGCDKAFVGQIALNSHIKFHHFLEKTIDCTFENCVKKFKTIGSLNAHLRTHSTLKPFRCDHSDCEYRSSTQKGIRDHQIKHSSERPFNCTFEGCLKSFKTEIVLKSHLMTHKTETVKCKHIGCDAVLRPSSLSSHEYTVHSNKTVSCDWPGCEFTTKRHDCLRRHQLIHSEEKNFVCDWPQCEKRFKSKHKLTLHLRIHNNDKRYPCLWPGCQYRCGQNANLKKHIKIHTKNSVNSFELKKN
jgi:uncharacterized Zn-finger protein